MRYLLFAYTLLILLLCIPNQAISAKFNMYTPLAQRISSENGLSQNVVLSQEIDQYGRLWVGTQDGLNLLNNNEFIIFHSDQEEYRLAGSTISDLALDTHGGLWVASEAGLDYIDTTTLDTRVILQTNSNKGISQLLLHENSLFYLSDHQLYRYNLSSNTTEKVTLATSITSIYSVTEFDQQHILLLDADNIIKLNTATGQLDIINPAIPEGIYKALNVGLNRIWISLKEQGLFSCDLTGGNCRVYSKGNNRLPTNNIAEISFINNKLYLSTDRGIGMLNLASDSLEWIYPHSQNNAYQASQIARNLILTPFGNIFVGTFNGLYRIPNNYKNVQAFNTGNGGYPEGQLAVNVVKLAGQDRLITAQPDSLKLWTLEEQHLKPYREYPYPQGFVPTSLEVDEGMIYLSSLTAGNLMLNPISGQYQPLANRFTQLGQGQLSNMDAPETNIRIFHVESMMKVYQRQHDQWRLLWQKQFPAYSATATYWQGRLWVAAYQDGLISASMAEDWQEPTDWQQHFGLGIVINLFANAKKLYVLTANLGVFEARSSQPVGITKVPVEDKLSGQTSVCAINDENGNVLLSGHKGLTILNEQSQFVGNLTVLQGVHEKEFTQFGCGKINGVPYFAGASGITLVYSISSSQIQTPTSVWTHLKTDNISLPIKNNQINQLPSSGLIRLHFIATPSDLPKQATYYYRINSLSDKWIELKSSFISLTNLRPGKYEVELKARDFAGNTGPITATTLEIMPGFWESPLAIVGYILFGLMAIAALVAIKHKSVQDKLALEVAKNLQQQDYSRQLEHEVYRRTQELAQKKEEAEEANIAKTRFIAAASHDFKHPINLMRLQLAQIDNAPLGEKIEGNLNFLDKLVSSIFELSRIDAKVLEPQIAPLDLAKFCLGIAEENQALLQHHGLSLDLQICEDLWVASDALLLRRIIDNILNNAIKISDAGSSIRMRIEQNESDAIIHICDHGPGMTAQMQAQLFTPFKRWTNRYQGSGLGLSVVKGISDLLNIQINLVSTLGIGSCFTLTLPQITAPVAHLPLEAALELAIVEDDKAQLTFLSEALTSRGIIVSSYINAEALLADNTKRFDVILSDIDLGTERDGLDYMDDYRQQLKGAKLVIYMSGNPEATSRVPVQTDLFFFVKPVKLGKLMWLINQSKGR